MNLSPAPLRGRSDPMWAVFGIDRSGRKRIRMMPDAVSAEKLAEKHLELGWQPVYVLFEGRIWMPAGRRNILSEDLKYANPRSSAELGRNERSVGAMYATERGDRR
jgi:hypothetical protein